MCSHILKIQQIKTISFIIWLTVYGLALQLFWYGSYHHPITAKLEPRHHHPKKNFATNLTLTTLLFLLLDYIILSENITNFQYYSQHLKNFSFLQNYIFLWMNCMSYAVALATKQIRETTHRAKKSQQYKPSSSHVTCHAMPNRQFKARRNKKA